MMATEVNQTYFAWSQGESTERDRSQGVSVSQTLDHGSISFGRFELESLSWEKWSVFSNDRRTEEFGKFNGLVAQKKAYFEEYYKRIRELKASQQQQLQQTELTLEYSGDGSDSSQTGEDEPAADLDTPIGSGTVVDDYAEEAPHETTSEHGLPCYENQGNENFSTEVTSSNLSSSAGVLQQTNQDVRGNVRGDISTSRMDLGQQNASRNAGSVHGDTGTAYEAARTPRRLIEKDPRLRFTPKIIPKSIKSLSKTALDCTFASERPGSLRSSTSMNQKTKPDNARSLQRPNAAPQKMAGITERSKATGVRRPSSATAQRPSAGERHLIFRDSPKKSADVSTLRRPSTAERRPVTRDRVQKQTNVTTPQRPSTSERRPVKRESAAKQADISTLHRPSTGERRTITRESVLRTDMKTPSKARATVAHSKGETTTVGHIKKAGTPNATRSNKLETKSNNNRLKGPSALDSSSTRSKRMDLQVSGKQKSSSVNLSPRKTSGSYHREPEVIARPKKNEGLQVTMQSRASISKKTTPLQTGNVKARASNPPPPPPPPRRPSRMVSKPNPSTSSTGGRKPRPLASQWH